MFDLAAAPAPAALSRQADTTLTDQLAARFAERIRQRLLAPGARLPSVRECALRHEVSPSTVVAAYDQLLAQGLVEARRQRGFFVRDAAPEARTGPAVAAARAPRTPLPISATTLIRGMFQPPDGRPMPGLGTLPVDWLDLPMLAAALRKVTQGAALGPLSLRYGEPSGDLRLRRALALRLGQIGIADAGGVLMGLSFLTLAVEPVWHFAPLATLGIGLGFFMLHNTLQTEATQMTPQARGTSVALFASMYFIGQTIGVALAAPVMDRFDARPLFAISAVLLPALAFWFTRRLQRKG